MVTNPTWFDNLSRVAVGPPPLRLDEACFWHPRALKPVVTAQAGELAFLKLKAPARAVGGYGFFAAFFVAPDVYWLWRNFGVRAGAASEWELGRLLGRRDAALREPIGCTLLRDVTLWPDARWIPWDASRGFADSNVRGSRETNPDNARVLLDAVGIDGMREPPDLAETFRLIEFDARRREQRTIAIREGQGTFKAVVLDAYERQCAITGEHTELVLQAAHIQPYLGPASNHVQNGLLLTSEFHTLFDAGLVAIDPPTALRSDYRVRVSKEIRTRWNNGHRYNDYDGRPLRVLPHEPERRPSIDALEWHLEHRFERAGGRRPRAILSTRTV
jgi:putative restriction endonuclease